MPKIESRRLLSACLAIAALLTLGACVQRSGSMQPANKTARLGTLIYSPNFENQAIVVVGLRRMGVPTFGYAIAGADGEKIDGRATQSWIGFFGTAPLGQRLTLAEDELDYHILRMPPGNYGVIQISVGTRYYLVSFQRAYNVNTRETYTFSPTRETYSHTDLIDPVATPETPIFSARANEVVYIGDLVFDGRDPEKRSLAISASPDGARAALAAFGETRPMETRMMVRPTGPDARTLAASPTTPATVIIQQIR